MRRRGSSLLIVLTAFTGFLLGGCGANSSSENVSSSEPSANAYRPQIKVDYNGNTVIVWYQWDGEHYSIYSSRYEEGTGWSDAELIEFDDTGDAYDPQIALDPNGNAVAVWYQYNGSIYNIMARCYIAASGWESAKFIETDNSGDAFDPHIVIDNNGNAVVVWYQWDKDKVSNIWANRYDSKIRSWGKARLIETDSDGNSFDPQIAIDSSGNVIVIWLQYDNSNYTIWSNMYNIDTGWNGAELIERYNNADVYYPRVEMDASGNAAAVWLRHDDSQYDILFNRYKVGSGWGTAEVVVTNNTNNIFNPRIAMDSNGNTIVIWLQYDGSRYNIWSNRYVIEAGWGTPELIETYDDGNVQDISIETDTNGNAVAVWSQYNGSCYNIWSNRYAVGIGWNTTELLENNDAGNANSPTVAVGYDGNTVVAWSQSDGKRYGIKAIP